MHETNAPVKSKLQHPPPPRHTPAFDCASPRGPKDSSSLSRLYKKVVQKDVLIKRNSFKRGHKIIAKFPNRFQTLVRM